MKNLKIFKTNLITKIITILFYLKIIYSESINITNNNFSIKKIKDESPLKIYLKENVDKYEELLYLEFSISEDVNNSTNYTNNYSPYYNIKVNWFNNITLSQFSKGVFYGIGQLKIYEKQNIFYDLKLCKIFHVINKCEDYFMNISISDPTIFLNFYNLNNSLMINEMKNYAENIFKNKFSPILDINNSNGTDDIYYYQSFPVTNENINEFKSQIRFKIIQGIYTKDKFDLSFDLNNLFLVYFGTFEKNINELSSLNKTYIERSDFKVYYFIKYFFYFIKRF